MRWRGGAVRKWDWAELPQPFREEHCGSSSPLAYETLTISKL